MWMYFFKRLMHGIPVLLTVATLTFGIMHLVPGGPFDTEKKLPPEIIANIEAKYHLDKPVWQQYLLYMKQILQGDMGPSYKYVGRDVSDIILERVSRVTHAGVVRGVDHPWVGSAGGSDVRRAAEFVDRSQLYLRRHAGYFPAQFRVGGVVDSAVFASMAPATAGVVGGSEACDHARDSPWARDLPGISRGSPARQ